MPFVTQAWYCSGWSHEISRQPMSRVILGESIVLFRKEDGSIVALGDTCPHRFAPLHLGELRGDAIECPYHGLQFGETGACTLNPHDGAIPRALKVKAYPIVERSKAVWIWMGDPESADHDLIPDCSHNEDPRFRTIFDRLVISGNYELVNDNLLDLTHTRFLHKSFQAPTAQAYEYEIEQDGQAVISVYNMRDGLKPEMLKMMWPEGPERVDTLNTMRWDAPANLLMINCNTGAGRPEEEGILAYTSHLITPETETTSHYFWSYARDWRLEDESFDETLRQGLDYVIRHDDEPMIALIQRKMGATGDLMSFRPVILPTDSAAMRARLIIAQMLKAESGAREDGKDAARRPALSAVASN